MASLPQHTPPLLLSKRLTHFLQTNTSPQIPTLLLTSPHGKLLAHASPNPVSLLRTHATVAASLLAIHTSSSAAVPGSLPGARTPDVPRSPFDGQSEHSQDEAGRDGEIDGPAAAAAAALRLKSQSQEAVEAASKKPLVKPVTITVQLSHGSVVVRRLRCNLLLVAIGPAADPSSSSASQQQPHHYHLSPNSSFQTSSHPGSSSTHENGTDASAPLQIPSGTSPGGTDSSVLSVEGQITASMDSSVAVGGAGAGSGATTSMRRNVGELARWLDDKLGGLQVPEDGLGQS